MIINSDPKKYHFKCHYSGNNISANNTDLPRQIIHMKQLSRREINQTSLV